MHNERKLLSNAETKTELEKERNNRVRESTQVQRSTGQTRPFRKKEKPWERGPGPQVPQGGGVERYSTKFFRGPTTYFIIYHL